jgi:predicted helicase
LAVDYPLLMPALTPESQRVRKYYATLDRYQTVGAVHEQAVKTAFHDVLQAAAGRRYTVVPEDTVLGKSIRYDGVLKDDLGIAFGYWEAKDLGDDLDREIRKKVEKGYSLRNTLFQTPERAVLYQDGRLVDDFDLTEADGLQRALAEFIGYREPEIDRFHEAVAEFKKRIPNLAQGLVAKIEEARREDPEFRAALEAFLETCREAINPNIRVGAVEEMLVQHMLTERLIRTVFEVEDFRRKNAIAQEIQKVVDALTRRHISPKAFLGQLDRYYAAIEDTARGIQDYAEKQAFLNTVYEQFFQGFSDRVADTHGIVYTPQPLVDFMVRSVDRLLDKHFGQRLASPDVHVLDPFVGTGNFLIRVMKEVPAPELPHKFKHELHANELMLLPYYVASLNIEHAYWERTGTYEPFEGIVLVDTFEMVEGKTAGMFSAENTARAQRQRESPIKVIIGNPPYNAHQVNWNDANQNRKYKEVDGRIKASYVAASKATLLNVLYDPYVRAFRWASDRIGDQGVIAFVTNNSFLDGFAFDGMRKHLAEDFDEVWVMDLGGNVRKNPNLSGTTHNVFGIQVGVAIAFLVRTGERGTRGGRATIRYAAAETDWRKEQKYGSLRSGMLMGSTGARSSRTDGTHG